MLAVRLGRLLGRSVDLGLSFVHLSAKMGKQADKDPTESVFSTGGLVAGVRATSRSFSLVWLKAKSVQASHQENNVQC